MPLRLDGVAELHADLFRRLDAAQTSAQRAKSFRDYMTVHFRLNRRKTPATTPRGGRRGAHYISVLRGWSINADSREGAVLKGWVESRFGLTLRFSWRAVARPSAPAYRHYLEMRAAIYMAPTRWKPSWTWCTAIVSTNWRAPGWPMRR